VEFTERGYVVLGYLISGEMEPAVEEHGTVACGEDETVTVEPTWGVGIKVHAFPEEDGSDFGAAEWKTQMT
jgi:hypothetical protein